MTMRVRARAAFAAARRGRVAKAAALGGALGLSEDRHAVVTYLRLVKPVKPKIPDPDRAATFDDKDAADHFFGQDAGTVPAPVN